MHRHTSNLLAGLLVLCSSLTANAAESSQVRPDQETLSELPTADWLTNGRDLLSPPAESSPSPPKRKRARAKEKTTN